MLSYYACKGANLDTIINSNEIAKLFYYHSAILQQEQERVQLRNVLVEIINEIGRK